jgi:hypothetical protein
MNNDWFDECRKFATKTNSLESFDRCIDRVKNLGRKTGFNFYRPMVQRTPEMLEFEAGGLYGGIVYRADCNEWTMHT